MNNMLNCMIICHGKSEFLLANHLKSTLRLPIKIVAEKNGDNSIQINSLNNFLNRKDFKNSNEFIRKYKLKIDNSLKVFVVMDVDDCNSNERKLYENKQMFGQHWLKKHITPIYNDQNFEDVIRKAKLPKMNSKTDVVKIFPSNLSDDKVESIKIVKDTFSPLNCTNLEILIDYLIKNKK